MPTPRTPRATIAARGRAVPAREVLTFLAVGGAGYLTDVAAFNWFRDQPVLGGGNPIGAKIAAVVVAMVITYLGNRMLTWRGLGSTSRRREVGLFAVFNLAGLMISVLALVLSHDVLGLTSRLADNISGNVVGVGLGTVFRYWAYKRFVFAGAPRVGVAATTGAPGPPAVTRTPVAPVATDRPHHRAPHQPIGLIDPSHQRRLLDGLPPTA